jgi:hypothetical protein
VNPIAANHGTMARRIDSNASCESGGKKRFENRFVFVSQNGSKKDSPNVKTGNEFLDAAIALLAVGMGWGNEASFGFATAFRCRQTAGCMYADRTGGPGSWTPFRND